MLGPYWNWTGSWEEVLSFSLYMYDFVFVVSLSCIIIIVL